MDVSFIGQGYNQTIGSSVGEELIIALSDPNYTSFKCLVAFASTSGVSAITPHIHASQISDYKVIIGIDQKGTSKEALEELLGWNVDVFIYYTRQNIIFHPKIYIFEGEDRALVIIGSNNFTQRGLVENIEGSLLLSIDKNVDGRTILSEIESYFSPMLTGSDNNLRPLSRELIDRLVAARKVPTEAQRRVQYAKERNDESNSGEADLLDDIFSIIPLQRKPDGFNPPRSSSTTSVSIEDYGQNTDHSIEPESVEGSEVESIENVWLFNNNDNVLIAEIGGPARWQQANFPKTVFENFFGAVAGNNNYTINLRHVRTGGFLQEIEVRQAVTVQSQNYRFELGASSGLTYPTGDRPIGVFIRLANQRFLYNLVMPNMDYYDEVNTYLVHHYNGPNRNLKRVNTNIDQLRTNCPRLPFWTIRD